MLVLVSTIELTIVLLVADQIDLVTGAATRETEVIISTKFLGYCEPHLAFTITAITKLVGS